MILVCQHLSVVMTARNSSGNKGKAVQDGSRQNKIILDDAQELHW